MYQKYYSEILHRGLNQSPYLLKHWIIHKVDISMLPKIQV